MESQPSSAVVGAHTLVSRATWNNCTARYVQFTVRYNGALRPRWKVLTMFVTAVLVAFALLFGVLLFDGLFSGADGLRNNQTDVSLETLATSSKTTAASDSLAATDSSLKFGDRQAVDGTPLAA